MSPWDTGRARVEDLIEEKKIAHLHGADAGGHVAVEQVLAA